MAEIVCQLCGDRDATCLGRAEGHEAYLYGCDYCCGHGDEDGHCELLADLPAFVTELSSEVAECSDTYGTLRTSLEAVLALAPGTRDAQIVQAARAAVEELELQRRLEKTQRRMQKAADDDEDIPLPEAVALAKEELAAIAALDAFRAKGGGG